MIQRDRDGRDCGGSSSFSCLSSFSCDRDHHPSFSSSSWDQSLMEFLVVMGPAVDGACACVCSSSLEAVCASICTVLGAVLCVV